MATKTKKITDATLPTAGLDPYGQLLKMLVPRARELAVYAANGLALWLSSGQDDPDMHAQAMESLSTAAAEPFDIDGFSKSANGATIYAFRLHDGQGTPLAAVVLMLPLTGDERPFSLVLGLVRPALDCLARELALRASIGALNRDLTTRDQDLDLLLGIANLERSAVRDADELGRLTQAAVEHLDCLSAAMIIPEKNIAVARRHRVNRAPGDTELLSKTHRHLMAWAQTQRRTLLVNSASGAAKLPSCKILSVPVRHESGRVMGFFVLFRADSATDFESRHVRLGELLVRKALGILQTTFDSATGLMTRAAFEAESLALMKADTAFHSNALIYIDLDHMYLINENHGMPIGDDVIIKFSDMLRRRAPRGSIVARIAGDRFALFLPATSLDDGFLVAERLLVETTEISRALGRVNISVGFSAGVAVVDIDSKQPITHALAAAELSCKVAKDNGRSRIERYETTDERMLRRNDDDVLRLGLKRSLVDNEFILYAQLMQPLGNENDEPRYEILVRRRVDGEILPPEKFLNSAERHEMMHELDAWVIKNTFLALAPYQAILHRRLVRFSINLSSISLQHESLVGEIKQAAASANISPNLICFELLESAAAADFERAESVVQQLRSLGFDFALDDFGTGQASLSYLRALPVTMLKIDGSFVRDSLGNSRSSGIVKAIAQIARTMGMKTVAEYVETDELRMRMLDLGVDYGQGFAIGKPQPLDELLQEIGVFAELEARSGKEP